MHIFDFMHNQNENDRNILAQTEVMIIMFGNIFTSSDEWDTYSRELMAIQTTDRL